jgi:hypothetical protein
VRMQSIKSQHAEASARVKHAESLADASQLNETSMGGKTGKSPTKGESANSTKKAAGTPSSQSKKIAEKGWISHCRKMETQNYHIDKIVSGQSQRSTVGSLCICIGRHRLLEFKMRHRLMRPRFARVCCFPIVLLLQTVLTPPKSRANRSKAGGNAPTTTSRAARTSNKGGVVAKSNTEAAFDRFRDHLHVVSMKWMKSRQEEKKTMMQVCA